MKQLELIELIRQHHPKAGHKEIRQALNRAQDDYCARTELLEKTYVQDSVAGQRYYEIHKDIIKITRVQINDVEIPRLIGNPRIDDDEFDSATGLGAAASSSDDRFWYIDTNRIGIVEKAINSTSRDGRVSNYQSISEVKEIRLFTVSQGTDFTTDLNQESELPSQFHEALIFKVVSDLHLLAEGDMDRHKIFYTKYMNAVKSGRAYGRMNYLDSGAIRQVHF